MHTFINLPKDVHDDNFSIPQLFAPPAKGSEAQLMQSCPSSVVNFSIKSLISQKRFHNFYSFFGMALPYEVTNVL